MLNKNLIHCLCMAALWSVDTHADVYKWFDSRGQPHYSGSHQEHAESLTVVPANAYFEVKKVFDGDTVLLSNGQKVRLLGINTPEVASHNKNSEAGGEQAKDWLRKRLEHQKVRLEVDIERQDKYQRSLAYIFTEDKQHINLELVRLGLATVNIYPPNLKYVDALIQAQQVAEKAGMGVWGNSAYAPQVHLALSEVNYKGWKRITGKVNSLKKTQKYSYLQFSDKVSVRVENLSLGLFPPLQDYIGKNIEARGWVNKNRDRFALHIRHPGDLKIF